MMKFITFFASEGAFLEQARRPGTCSVVCTALHVKAASWCARTCTRHRPPLRSAGRLLLLTRSDSHLLFGDHVTGLLSVANACQNVQAKRHAGIVATSVAQQTQLSTSPLAKLGSRR